MRQYRFPDRARDRWVEYSYAKSPVRCAAALSGQTKCRKTSTESHKSAALSIHAWYRPQSLLRRVTPAVGDKLVAMQCFAKGVFPPAAQLSHLGAPAFFPYPLFPRTRG